MAGETLPEGAMPVFSIARRPLLRASLGGVLGLPLAAGARASQTRSPDPARLRKAITETDTLTRRLQAGSGIPGIALAIVQGEKPLFAKGYGVREAGKAGAVDADTVFQLASISKPLGATVVAHQVGIGSLAWNSRMQDLLPWFSLSSARATRDLTIADLYAHRSGLPDHAGDELEELGYDRMEILRRLRYLPLEGFRTHYAYTNMGITAAAQAVAEKAGLAWSSLCETALYQKLGMNRTTSRFPVFEAMENRAVGHMPEAGRFVPAPVRDPQAQSPAGGASSSVNDMAKWISLILGLGRYRGEQIVAADALAPALTPQMQISPARDGHPASYYGFGFNVGTSDGGYKMLSHSGAFLLGAATNVMMLPALGLGIVVLTNAWPVGVAEAIGLTFLDYVQFGAPQKDWMKVIAPVFAQMRAPQGAFVGKQPPANPMPAQPLSAYQGIYRNIYYGPLTVLEESGGLVLQAGPSHVRLPCEHWEGDEFAIYPRNENAPPGSAYKVSFSGHPATRVTTDFLDEAGIGGFTR
ncbi:serine hydrolase [Acidocella sp.]|uniref:serine hydrolase n=1 Tax=Acidocella sp. TaxID=50710 RepID=UPI003D040139